MESLYDEWIEFLRSLTRHRARFVVVGGHAVAHHAAPRFTEDLDVFVEPSPANARRVHSALLEFAGIAPPLAALATKDKVFMLGRKPFRVDVLTAIDGVSFAAAWKGRRLVDIADFRIAVIGRRELIANKRAAGRPKDEVDLVSLGVQSSARSRSSASSRAAKSPSRAESFTTRSSSARASATNPKAMKPSARRRRTSRR